MASDTSRCFATLGVMLQDAIGKVVLVKLRENHEIRGILRSFDQHVNLLLDNAEEIVNGTVYKRGTVVIRGENVLLISPVT